MNECRVVTAVVAPPLAAGGRAARAASHGSARRRGAPSSLRFPYSTHRDYRKSANIVITSPRNSALLCLYSYVYLLFVI